MTDKQLDINLKNALQPSYFPDNDVNRSLMDKIRSIEEVTDKDDDSRRSEERASRIRDARRPISWLVKAAIFFLVFSAVGTGGVLAANYLLKKSEVSEHGVTVGGTVNDDDLAEPWEDVPNEKLGTEEGSEGDLWYSKEVVLTNGVYQNSYYYYKTYEDGIKDSGFPNIFSESIGTPQSICYVVTEDSSTGQAVEGDAFEKTLDSIFDCTCLLAPEPSASIIITAPTPIIIPNEVNAERILLTFNEFKARIKGIKDDETKDIDDRVWIPEKIKEDIFVNIK